MNEFLAFVKKIGNTLDGLNIYEFLFTTDPNIVWGDNFNIIPAGIIPNLMPENNCLSRKGRIFTDKEFKLACDSTCFSMMDCIDGIISVCFTEAGIDDEFHFDFGETFESVNKTLKKYGLKLEELEDIKLYDDTIIDDVVKKLSGNSSDIDDIF